MNTDKHGKVLITFLQVRRANCRCSRCKFIIYWIHWRHHWEKFTVGNVGTGLWPYNAYYSILYSRPISLPKIMKTVLTVWTKLLQEQNGDVFRKHISFNVVPTLSSSPPPVPLHRTWANNDIKSEVYTLYRLEKQQLWSRTDQPSTVKHNNSDSDNIQESPADARVTRDNARAPSFQDACQPPSWILSNRK